MLREYSPHPVTGDAADVPPFTSLCSEFVIDGSRIYVGLRGNQ